ncbi:MAG: DUF5685 family protein [Eubacteriales bacterium]|nr:DUF5685 family protein [Eubacteriales bacterium]MDD4512042.1 DUF5685 family protein [Eubacteriales bacterium]
MFGYVTIDASSLSEESRKRYEAYYCGLCRELKNRYGAQGQLTLSYDMTFLLILLSSLYEPEEKSETRSCVVHPIKKRQMLTSDISAYCADMNIALAYYKCLDNWKDDKSLAGLSQAKLLKKAYGRVEESWPEKCAAIKTALDAIDSAEKSGEKSVDALANQTAAMLGEIYAYKQDIWQDALRCVGGAVGRFIYLMDAYEDLPADKRLGRFNPLREMSESADYETLLKDALSLLIAEGTEAFETLPCIQDVDILRNILYSGVWARYAAITARREKKRKLKAAKQPEADGSLPRKEKGK